MKFRAGIDRHRAKPRRRAQSIFALVLAFLFLGSATNAIPALASGNLPVNTHSAANGDSVFRATDRSTRSVIFCELKIDNVHESSTKPRTINVHTALGCTAKVTHMSMIMYMYRDGKLVSISFASKSLTNLLQGNVAYDFCKTGTYQGKTTGTVVFPPGFEPPTWTGRVASPLAKNPCKP